MSLAELHPDLAELAVNWEAASIQFQQERDQKSLAIDLALYEDALRLSPNSSKVEAARDELLEGIKSFAPYSDRDFPLASLAWWAAERKPDGILDRVAVNSQQMNRINEAWLSSDPHLYVRVDPELVSVFKADSDDGLRVNISKVIDKRDGEPYTSPISLGSELTLYGLLDDEQEPRVGHLTSGLSIDPAILNHSPNGRIICIDATDALDYSKKPFFRYFVGKVAIDSFMEFSEDSSLLQRLFSYTDIEI